MNSSKAAFVHCAIIIIIINLLFYVLRYYIPRNRNVFTYFHKAYGVIGNWPKEKGMIVMLSFPSKKQASDWVILPEVKEAKFIENSVTVTVNFPAKQAYKNNQIKVILRFVKTFLSSKSVLESS
jgi:hypothetical protein